jgi:hypothetical protein
MAASFPDKRKALQCFLQGLGLRVQPFFILFR